MAGNQSREADRGGLGMGASMTKLKTGVLLVFLLLPSAGLAAALQGPGAASCAQFAEFYRADPTNTDTMFFTWAQGYMSGLNMATLAMGGKSADFTGIAAAVQKNAFRDYCVRNPSGQFMDGITEFLGKLPIRKLELRQLPHR